MSKAVCCVIVSSDIIDILVDVRDYLKTESEPSIYVSDRRLVQTVKMLKVAAFTNGRLTVSPFDCLLLQHCLWQKPAQQDYILNYILDKLSCENEVPNFDVIGQRLFARCCLVLTGAGADELLESDLNNLQIDVYNRIKQITSYLSNISTILEKNLWIDCQEASLLSATLVPKLEAVGELLEELSLEIEVLKIIITEKKEPSICAELLGERWAEFLKTPLKLKETF